MAYVQGFRGTGLLDNVASLAAVGFLWYFFRLLNKRE